MKASELKQKAFDSISKEIKEIEKLMCAAADKGMLRIEISNLSDAARVWLQDNGFEVKLFITAGEVRIDKNKFTISWGK